MVLISVSLTPLAAAVVAAPIRNEWPLYALEGTPAQAMACFTCTTNACFVRCPPTLSVNNGPTVPGRLAKYCNMAATGHSDALPLPMMIVTPWLNWSVFDDGILTAICVGAW